MDGRAVYNAEAFRTLLCRDRKLPALLVAHEELCAARGTTADAKSPVINPLKDALMHVRKQCDAEQDVEGESELKEIGQLLENPHVQALFDAYQGISNEMPDTPQISSLPSSPIALNGPTSRDGPSGAEEMNLPLKLVGLNKVGKEPLGIMLRAEGKDVKISRILVGMGADRQGLLHVGDIIHEVNGEPVNGDVEKAQKQLQKTSGTVTLKVIPTYLDQLPVSQVYMRAHFDYDPQKDEEHPFASGGLAFERSDVLLIMSQDDPSWWQAKIEGGSERAGLIPALLLEERRRAQARDPGLPEGRNACFGLRRKGKSKPVMYSAKKHAEYDRHELNIYEEVARIGPGQRKTVMFIGAQGVGRRGLKQRLITSNPDQFTTTLPHTTRPPRAGEEDGKHYWFISKEAMMADIAAHKFLEYGNYEGDMYGTKIDSIRAVIRSGKTCLLDANPQSLKRLRTSEFKPYVIFIKAPPFPTLKRMHQDAARSNSNHEVGPYSDEDLQRTIHESQQIEDAYMHFFDKSIVNDGLDNTYKQLVQLMRELDANPQWVPINWVF